MRKLNFGKSLGIYINQISFENCTWMERPSRNCYSPQVVEILGNICFLKQNIYRKQSTGHVHLNNTTYSGRDCLPNISQLRSSQTDPGKLIPFLVLTLFF